MATNDDAATSKSSTTSCPSSVKEENKKLAPKAREITEKTTLSKNKHKDNRRHSLKAMANKTMIDQEKSRKNFSSIKVYAVSNFSTKERLRKKIERGRANDPILIDWEKIMAQ